MSAHTRACLFYRRARLHLQDLLDSAAVLCQLDTTAHPKLEQLIQSSFDVCFSAFMNKEAGRFLEFFS